MRFGVVEQPPRVSGLGHVPALTGVRGVAVALVVGWHYYHFPFGGQGGVDIFFVLSGFLITTLLLEEHAKYGRIGIASFYRRRARRLLPALAAMLATFVAAGAVNGRNLLGVALIGASYAGNALHAYGSHWGQLLADSPLAPLWSLAEEEQFYLVWPALLLLLARSRHPGRWLSAAIVGLSIYRLVLVVGGHSPVRIYFGPDTHADPILAGCLLAFLRRGGFRVGEGLAKVAVALVSVCAVAGWWTPAWGAWGMPLLDLGALLLIAAAYSPTELARGLACRPLVWLGDRSYSLYLWHVPVLAVVGGARPAAVLVSVAAAAGSYAWIEKPFRRRRNARLEQARVSSVATP